MRLIDLDQQIFVPIVDDVQGTSYEVQMTIAELFDRFFEGFQPQAVDAVPVGWIRSLMLDGWPDDSKAAWRVLKAWEGEQGVR